MRGRFWLAVMCGGIILTIGLGSRQSFGIFQTGVAADLGVGRELWSFSTSFSMLLMGLVSPFVGNVADRFGSARTVAGGATIYVAGMFIMAFTRSDLLLHFGNALSGVGMAAASFGPILGVIGRTAPAHHRSLALGVATAGGSFGQFAIVPLASTINDLYGNWQTTMLVLAILSIAMIPLAAALRESRKGAAGAALALQSTRQALREAWGVRGFWLLTIGFFVCGFHVAFVGLHLPAYVSDHAVGLEIFGRGLSPAELGGWAIGLVGLFNIAGSVMWGWLGGKHPRKDMLALLYFLRALSFILFIILPLSAASVLIFAATLGFLWLGTVPLTSGLVGYVFGPTYMSMLYGIVFMGHQVGSFVGGWGGGKLFDITGSYTAMWWISVALGLTAAALNWAIVEKPVARLAPSPAPA